MWLGPVVTGSMRPEDITELCGDNGGGAGMSSVLHVCGGTTLRGELAITGSCGAGLALLAACAATTHEVQLSGLPLTRSIARQADVLRQFGRTVEQTEDGWRVHPGACQASLEGPLDLPWSALLFLGPILAHRGECCLPLPRPCVGSGPLDPYGKILRALGATIEMDAGQVRVATHQLQGGEVYLDIPHFGATWTAITAATRARGRTRIIGASRAPELVDAVNLLNRMGARIVGAGTEAITIAGGTSWTGGVHEVIPDRIAGGFYLIAGAATGGEVCVQGVISDHLRALAAKLEETGAEVEMTSDCIRVRGSSRPKPVSLRTGFYPSFPSLLRPAMCSLLLRSHGTSVISETVIESGLHHLDELERMGAQITRDGQIAVIRGGAPLGAARVRAQDPGSAAALIIAALMADGTSCIEKADELLAWFPAPCDHLAQLGSEIRWQGKSQAAG